VDLSVVLFGRVQDLCGGELVWVGPGLFGFLDSDAGRTDLNWSAVAVLVDHTEPDTNILQVLSLYICHKGLAVERIVSVSDGFGSEAAKGTGGRRRRDRRSLMTVTLTQGSQ